MGIELKKENHTQFIVIMDLNGSIKIKYENFYKIDRNAHIMIWCTDIFWEEAE